MVLFRSYFYAQVSKNTCNKIFIEHWSVIWRFVLIFLRTQYMHLFKMGSNYVNKICIYCPFCFLPPFLPWRLRGKGVVNFCLLIFITFKVKASFGNKFKDVSFSSYSLSPSLLSLNFFWCCWWFLFPPETIF